MSINISTIVILSDANIMACNKSSYLSINTSPEALGKPDSQYLFVGMFSLKTSWE